MTSEPSSANYAPRLWGVDGYLCENAQMDGQPMSVAPQFGDEMASMLQCFGAMLSRHLDEVRDMIRSAVPLPLASESKQATAAGQNGPDRPSFRLDNSPHRFQQDVAPTNAWPEPRR